MALGRRTTAIVAGTSLLAATACTTGEPGAIVVRTDSAGIRIVVSHAPAWAPDEAWRIEGPILTIGSLDGPEPTQLHRVRAARRLPNGHVVIGDGGSTELRFFDANGQWIRSVGRAGDGPGEFRLISRFQVLPPDTLLVYDNAGPRVTAFTMDGTLIESRRVAAPGENVQAPDHRLPDGRWLNRFSSPEVDGFQRRRNAFVTWSEGGTAVDTLLEGDGQEYLIYRRFNGTQYLGRGVALRPFGGSDLAAIGPDRFALGNGLTHDIAVAELGDQQHRIRRSAPNAPLPAGAVNRFIDDYVGRYAAERQQEVRDQFATVPSGDATPAYSALAFDGLGNLWTEHFRFAWDSLAPRMWSVHDRTGEWLGTLEVPRKLGLLEIGSDYLLGVERDEDGVELVKLYRISRPG